MFPTRPQVEQLAPDASSIKAAGKVSGPSKWRDVAAADDAVWGICKGSREYRVRVDLRDLASTCSCPSRKFPCKHALGLLFLCAVTPPPPGEPPPTAAEWLTKRRAKAEAKENPKDPDEGLTAEQIEARDARREKSRARSRGKREARVTDGVAGLDLWLRDLMREGLSDLDSRPFRFFTDRAQALGDAQAPGLRRRLMELAEIPGSSADWTQRMLDRLGQLALLADAWGRQDQLPEPLRTDLRSAIGFQRKKEDTLRDGESVTDRWLVAGQVTEELELVFSERTWLLGTSTHRPALVVRYARNPGAFGPVLLPSTTFEGTLAFQPSALPLRALLVERMDAQPAHDLPAGACHDGIEPFLDYAATCIGAVPWTWLLPCALTGATPLRRKDGTWWLCDAQDKAVRLSSGQHWTLLAISGGRPVDVFGEWSGDRFNPLMVAGEYGLRRLDVEAL